MERMQENNILLWLCRGVLMIFLSCFFLLPVRALTYDEVRSTKQNASESLPYLERLYVERSSCIVDAAVLATAFVFDVRYKNTDSNLEVELPLACIDDTKLGMKTELLELQFSICESLFTPQGIEKTKCEELAKKPAGTGKFYGILWDGDTSTLWKKIDAKKPQKPEKASEVYIAEKRNAMSLLRQTLHQEKNQYLQILTTLQNAFVTSGDTPSVLLQGKTIEQASMQAELSIVGSLEWFQQFYFSYPQHRLYQSMLQKVHTTMELIHDIARIFEQFRYTLPNSSIDGDSKR